MSDSAVCDLGGRSVECKIYRGLSRSQSRSSDCNQFFAFAVTNSNGCERFPASVQREVHRGRSQWKVLRKL